MTIVDEGVRINVNNEHHPVLVTVAKNNQQIAVDEQLVFAEEAPKNRESERSEMARPSTRRKS